MSSSQRPERVVHQDYIARIRYSNALPPPPNPPKLLDIPGTGLAGGQYTSAGYASRLAREQPLNIEADAELGMPIDMIGIPGIFNGDERAISTRPGPQTIHPADKALLRPLAALSKTTGNVGGVSFLRRTEYVASQTPQQISNATPKDLLRLRNDPKRRKTTAVNKDDPINIIRNVVKGFDIAYPKDAYTGEESTTSIRGAAVTDPEARAWSHPKHPTNQDATVIDSYPLLPDLDALPPNGFYTIARFMTNPAGASDHYDARLDTALLRPVDNPEADAEYERKKAEWDPKSSRPEPLPEYDYEYYLPESAQAVRGIKRKFDVNDPDNDDPELYRTDEDEEVPQGFKYTRIRTYEVVNQIGDANNFYSDSVALALHDAETDSASKKQRKLAKAAYFYPIIQRTALRPKRNVGRLAASQMGGGEDRIDEVILSVVDLPEEDVAKQAEWRAKLDGSLGRGLESGAGAVEGVA